MTNARNRAVGPSDLHGNTPDKSEVALLLVDVINDFQFPGADALARSALPMAKRLAALKKRAASAGVPVIYANDNFGRWRSDFGALVRHVRESDGPGAQIGELLAPAECDYFVLKVRQSGFFGTCLDLLLSHLGVERLVLCGVASDNCVHMTAADAYLRGYELIVPRDGCAAESAAAHKAALSLMERVLKVRTPPCSQVRFPGKGRRKARQKAR